VGDPAIWLLHVQEKWRRKLSKIPSYEAERHITASPQRDRGSSLAFDTLNATFNPRRKSRVSGFLPRDNHVQLTNPCTRELCRRYGKTNQRANYTAKGVRGPSRDPFVPRFASGATLLPLPLPPRLSRFVESVQKPCSPASPDINL